MARSVRNTVATALPAAVLAAIAVAGCGGDSTPAPPPAPSTPQSAQPAPPATSAPQAKVDKEQAGKIATDTYGGRVLNVEPDTAQGRPTWEVEVADSRQGRIEVDIAQDDGTVLEMEHD